MGLGPRSLQIGNEERVPNGRGVEQGGIEGRRSLRGAARSEKGCALHQETSSPVQLVADFLVVGESLAGELASRSVQPTTQCHGRLAVLRFGDVLFGPLGPPLRER